MRTGEDFYCKGSWSLGSACGKCLRCIATKPVEGVEPQPPRSFHNIHSFHNDPHYQMIAVHYGSRTAKRSGVPLMNHIDEGLVILEHIGATERAMAAFCLHPLVQSDEDLEKFLAFRLDSGVGYIKPLVMAMAMEYRAVANAYLSHDYGNVGALAKLSPIKCVNDMLIADKVQNCKDFMIHHYGKHENSDKLYHYFQEWLKVLQVRSDEYLNLVELIG